MCHSEIFQTKIIFADAAAAVTVAALSSFMLSKDSKFVNFIEFKQKFLYSPSPDDCFIMKHANKFVVLVFVVAFSFISFPVLLFSVATNAQRFHSRNRLDALFLAHVVHSHRPEGQKSQLLGRLKFAHTRKSKTKIANV